MILFLGVLVTVTELDSTTHGYKTHYGTLSNPGYTHHELLKTDPLFYLSQDAYLKSIRSDDTSSDEDDEPVKRGGAHGNGGPKRFSGSKG